MKDYDTLDVMPWEELYFYMASTWRQGEHVCLIGPTGCGKTTLARELLPLRRFVIAFAVKREDDSLTALGWPIIRDWPLERMYERSILWPKVETLDSFQRQHEIMRKALRDIYTRGRWTVYADDLGYMSNTLKLDREIRAIAQQGRSAKITLVSSIQRASWVPVDVYAQVGHLFLWRAGDARDSKRLTEIAGAGPVDTALMFYHSRNLPQHGFLYIHVPTGRMVQSELATADAVVA